MDSRPDASVVGPDHAAVFQALTTPYLLLTPDLVVVDANRAYLAVTGCTLAGIVGRPVGEVVPGGSDAVDVLGRPAQLCGVLGRARDTGLPQTVLVRADAPEDVGRRLLRLTGTAVPDGSGSCGLVLLRAEDVVLTEDGQASDGEPADGRSSAEWRRHALDVQADLQTRAAELAAARRGEALTARRLAALARVALQVSRAETVHELIRVVTEGGLTALGAHGGAVAVPEDGDHLRLVMTEGLRAAAGGGDGVLPRTAPYPGCVAARTGELVLLPDRAATEAFAPVMSDLVRSTGAVSWAALPLETGGRRLGSLSVAWTGPRTFPAEEVDLLVAFAAQCAQALERIGIREVERVEHAAAQGMAEVLQRSLLTEPPRPDRLEIVVRYVPAAHLAQVGGDWYDAFPLADGRTALVIGDVTGHDRYAAAAMAQVRNVLRGIAHSTQDGPAAVLAALDRAMRDLAVDNLATAVLATVEPHPDGTGSRLLRWSNAGHPPPLLIGPDGAVTVLEEEPDLLLGVDPAAPRHDHEQVLAPGATVLFYTDGLIERRGATLDQGLDWLTGAVTGCAGSSLPEMCDRLLDRLAGPVEDDVALLALRPRRDG